MRATMAQPRKSFGLSGPSKALDPRVNAMRGDLADISLAGKHFSPHYVSPVEKFCVTPFAGIFDKPEGRQISELLQGETFMLLDISGGWAWGYSKHDHYVGYVQADVLGDTPAAGPALKAPDAASAAESFLGKTYVWGGRGGSGIDCSGLVQRSLAAVGKVAPRDSDMQLRELGTPLPDGAGLQRGDLVFFPGHVGIMADGETLIHATQHYGETVKEPLADVVARIAREHALPVLARKRLDA